MLKVIKRIVKKFSIKEQKNKFLLLIYITLRLSVLICLILEIINKNYHNVFLCILTLIMFMIPSIINKKLKIEFPSTLEAIIIMFIFSAQILGEIQNFYKIFKYWDTILHSINGFICAGIGFSLIDIINKNDKIKFSLSSVFVTIVAFCFSMTIGVMWEFFEFTMDRYFNKDMQKDRIVQKISSVELNKENKNKEIIINNIEKTVIYYDKNKTVIIENGYLDIGIIDTMKDLMVNFLGALVFSVFGFLYIHNRDKYKIFENCIIRLNN